MKAFAIAMDSEAQCVISRMTHVREERMFGRRVVRGDLNGDAALVVVSGIGKTNAAAAAQLALQLSGCGRLYNIGVAGGLEPDMKPGDMFEVGEAVQYDFDLSGLNGTEVGVLNERRDRFIPCTVTGRLPAKRLGTGDRFDDGAEDAVMLSRLGVGLRDMEGGAIAHVCETSGVEFVSWKCVSDVFGRGSMTGQFRDNLGFCLEILERLAADI